MTPPIAEQWRQCKDALAGVLSREDAEGWLAPLELDSIDRGKAVLRGIPNQFFRSRIRRQFSGLLRECLAHAFDMSPLDGEFRLELHVATQHATTTGREVETPSTTFLPRSSAPASTHTASPNQPEGFRQNFLGFVEGEGNRLALGFAKEVAGAPGGRFNPLFLVAGIGLGKTHLLHAIAAEVQVRFAPTRICYETAEGFTNAVVDGIRQRRMRQVREKYRQVDLLLLDDIEFLAVSERAQEELLHTFDAVHGAGGQLVFSCDRPPGALRTFNPTLRSRLEMGLVTDIAPADHELRLQVVRARAKAEGMRLPEEAAQVLAERITSGLRPLAGALVRLIAYASMLQEPITVEFVERIADPFFDKTPEPASLPVAANTVIARVCDGYGLTMKTLISRGRSAQVVKARGVAAYLLRELAGMSFPEIGAALGGRSHAAIIRAQHRTRRDLQTDPYLQRAVDQMREDLAPPGK